MNLFADLKGKVLNNGFSWLNEPQEWKFGKAGLYMYAPASTDFFNDPEGPNINNTAPYLFTTVKGDFVLTTRIDIEMAAIFDAASVMIMKDGGNWAKFCYENWLNEPSIVSVVTRSLSDDSPSLRIGKVKPYLRVIRSGSCFGFHYSLNAREWVIIRFFHMDLPEEIKVGVSAQSPMGKGCKVNFELLELELGKITTAKYVK